METIIEILIDKSGSMGYMKGQKNFENKYLLPDGSTRMTLLKRMLKNEIIPTIDYAKKVVVRTFRIGGEKLDILEVETIYEGAFNGEDIIERIEGLEDPPLGGTPISAALETSIQELIHFKEYDRKIILLTDGEENGQGNYLETAKKAIDLHGIPCKIFIVGICQDDSAREKSKQLAEITKGHYFNVHSTNYNKEYIRKTLLPLKKKVIESSLSNLTAAASLTVSPQPEFSTVEISDTSSVPSSQSEKANSITKETSHEEKNSLSEEALPKNSKEKADLNEVVEKNSRALTLITKQLDNLQQEISSLRTNFTDFEESEEVVIKENKELNERIRAASEEYVYKRLKEKYSERLQWLNENGESGENHDFKVIDFDGTVEYFIECKGTSSDEKCFLLTRNEWELFLNNTKNYQIYFVANALTSPEIIKIDNLLDWLMKGKILPLSEKNRKVKANRILMTIVATPTGKSI